MHGRPGSLAGAPSGRSAHRSRRQGAGHRRRHPHGQRGGDLARASRQPARKPGTKRQDGYSEARASPCSSHCAGPSCVGGSRRVCPSRIRKPQSKPSNACTSSPLSSPPSGRQRKLRATQSRSFLADRDGARTGAARGRSSRTGAVRRRGTRAGRSRSRSPCSRCRPTAPAAPSRAPRRSPAPGIDGGVTHGEAGGLGAATDELGPIVRLVGDRDATVIRAAGSRCPSAQGSTAGAEE